LILWKLPDRFFCGSPPRLKVGNGPVFDLLAWRTQRLPVHRLVCRPIGISRPTIATLTVLEFAS
jgi:hypothetical protein